MDRLDNKIEKLTKLGTIKSCRHLPLRIRGDLLHEVLHLWFAAVVPEVALEVLDGLVVRQYVAGAARYLLHVVPSPHYHF